MDERVAIDELKSHYLIFPVVRCGGRRVDLRNLLIEKQLFNDRFVCVFLLQSGP